MLQDLLPNALLRHNFYDKLVPQNFAGSAPGNLALVHDTNETTASDNHGLGCGSFCTHTHTHTHRIISEICPREERQAVVLVFDMCGFTQLCRQEGNVVLASIMHDLFSSFDKAVRPVEGLFKMDTIGDAYIAAHMLSNDLSETRDTYYKMLWLSGVMISTLEDYRRQRGKNVECRIGIAAGLVVTGALGWLQPRFHLRGPAMHVAEELEQTAIRNSVHVPCCFLHALQPSRTPVSCCVSGGVCGCAGVCVCKLCMRNGRACMRSLAPQAQGGCQRMEPQMGAVAVVS